jgi:hypothetical protein
MDTGSWGYPGNRYPFLRFEQVGLGSYQT